MHTTLKLIRTKRPCKEGWEKLLTYLGKTRADDKPLSLLTILESNGVDDAIWALRATPGSVRKACLFAVRCARRVEHLMTDPRSREALNVAERYANSEATADELKKAVLDAIAAATSATYDFPADAAYFAANAADTTNDAEAIAAVYYAARAACYAASTATARRAERAAQAEIFKELFS